MEWTHATGTANPRSTAHTARLLAAAVAVACSAAAWVVGHRALAGARSAWGAPEPLEPLGWLVQAALAVVVAWLAAGFALAFILLPLLSANELAGGRAADVALSRPSLSLVRNRRLPNSSPERSMKRSAGNSRPGSLG